jgi:glutathione S-transferase
MLTLYGFGPVGNTLKPLLALYEKELAFESRLLHMARFEQHEDWYKAINPNGMVPSLVHDGRAIIESTVICEYLEDVFPQRPLRPADPALRADMRVWTKWVDETFCWCVSAVSWDRTVSRMARALSDEAFARQLERIPTDDRKARWKTAREGLPQSVLDLEMDRIRTSLRKLEARLSRNEWLVDGGYTLADICTFAIVNNMPAGFPDIVNEEATPGIMRWAQRIRTRPAAERMVRENEHSFHGRSAAT